MRFLFHYNVFHSGGVRCGIRFAALMWWFFVFGFFGVFPLSGTVHRLPYKTNNDLCTSLHLDAQDRYTHVSLSWSDEAEGISILGVIRMMRWISIAHRCDSFYEWNVFCILNLLDGGLLSLDVWSNVGRCVNPMSPWTDTLVLSDFNLYSSRDLSLPSLLGAL